LTAWFNYYTILFMNTERIRRLNETFLRIVNKFRRLEKLPADYGSGHPLFPAEIHTVELIGRNPGIAVTEVAKRQGVTKGAVSQVVKKLDEKGLVRKCKSLDNEKSILLILTERGKLAVEGHQRFHAKNDQEMLTELLGMSEDQLATLERFEELLEKTLDEYMTDLQ